jgi:hypothetical protein
LQAQQELLTLLKKREKNFSAFLELFAKPSQIFVFFLETTTLLFSLAEKRRKQTWRNLLTNYYLIHFVLCYLLSTDNVIRERKFSLRREKSSCRKGHQFVSSKQGCENRMEHGDLFLPPELEDTLYLLTVESRLKELKQECEDLAEHSKRLHQDGQQLRERFEAGMKRSQALQMQVEQHMSYLRAEQQALREYRNHLQQFFNDH